MGEGTREIPGLEGVEVFTSSLCPPDIVYLFTAPPTSAMFDSEDEHRRALEEWGRSGVCALELGSADTGEEGDACN